MWQIRHTLFRMPSFLPAILYGKFYLPIDTIILHPQNSHFLPKLQNDPFLNISKSYIMLQYTDNQIPALQLFQLTYLLFYTSHSFFLRSFYKITSRILSEFFLLIFPILYCNFLSLMPFIIFSQLCQLQVSKFNCLI